MADQIPPLLELRCPVCGVEREMEYAMIGLLEACPACSSDVRFERILGTVTPNTGYVTTIVAFENLLSSTRRAQVVQILARAGYALRGGEVVDASGAVFDLVTVHRRLQLDPGLQGAIYQVGMDLSHQGY